MNSTSAMARQWWALTWSICRALAKKALISGVLRTLPWKPASAAPISRSITGAAVNRRPYPPRFSVSRAMTSCWIWLVPS